MNGQGQTPFLVLAGVAIALGGVACQQQASQQAQESTAVDTAAIRAELESIRSEFEKAYTAGEFKGIANYIHPEMIYSPPGSPPIQGRDTVIAYDRATFPAGATVDIESIDLRVMSGEWAYDYGTVTTTFTPEGSDSEQTMEGTYLLVLRHTDNGWQLYRESFSSNGSMSGGS